MNAMENESNFSTIPEREVAAPRLLGVGNLRPNEYVQIEEVDQSLGSRISQKTLNKYPTPFVYQSMSDFRQPKGYQNSDMKTAFIAAQLSRSKMVAPVVKMNQSTEKKSVA